MDYKVKIVKDSSLKDNEIVISVPDKYFENEEILDVCSSCPFYPVMATERIIKNYKQIEKKLSKSGKTSLKIIKKD